MTQQITPLPPPPQRGSAPDNFSATADAFLGALPQFAAQANALGQAIEADKLAAAGSAGAAHNSAAAAGLSAGAAAGSVIAAAERADAASESAIAAAESARIAHEVELGNVEVLIDDTVVSATRTWSSQRLQMMRDALSWMDTTTAASKTLVDRERCRVTTAGKTITLPASPKTGAEVGVSVGNWTDTVIDGGGALVCFPGGMGAQVVVNRPFAAVQMYFDSVVWRVR